jgi:FAD/FMN-containing dehydrogenase
MVTEQRTETQTENATAALARQVRGSVVTPAHAEYAAACAIWNGMIERRPAVIVRAADGRDVAAAVRTAREFGLPLAMRGGGHNVAGTALCDGGIVIDMREMRSVSIDPATRRVRVQGGALLAEIDAATHEHGLAVPVGVVSATGIAGLTLGGGLGWLRRKYGLTVDNLLGATVVLADGRTVTASAEHHSDLFWALRGGGGNFGVVTEFEFQAHLVGREMTMLVTFLPIEESVRALKFAREYLPTVPDELSAFAIVGGVPDAEMFPAAARGRDALIFAAAWCGDLAEGERVIAPLRTFTTPLADLSGRWSYKDAVQKFFDEDYPAGGRYYWKSQYINALTDEAIEGLVQLGVERPSKASTIDLWHLGGAIARVAPDATPIPQRQAEYLVGIEATWDAGDTGADEANIAWAREVWTATQRWSPAGVYVNFAGLGEEGADLVRASYGANYERLARVKAAYDPTNLFRVNQNIPPAS